MNTATLTPQKIVKQINAHCDKGNGIYVTWPAGDYGGTGMWTSVAPRCVRCFRAMVIGNPFAGSEGAIALAYVTPDFGRTWVRVEADTTFSDGNWNAPIGGLPITGRTTPAYTYGENGRVVDKPGRGTERAAPATPPLTPSLPRISN